MNRTFTIDTSKISLLQQGSLLHQPSSFQIDADAFSFGPCFELTDRAYLASLGRTASREHHRLQDQLKHMLIFGHRDVPPRNRLTKLHDGWCAPWRYTPVKFADLVFDLSDLQNPHFAAVKDVLQKHLGKHPNANAIAARISGQLTGLNHWYDL